MPRTRFRFRFSQSADSRRVLRVSRELQAAFKQAARTVAFGEIEGLEEFELGVVGMSDEELLALNIRSLGHDWYTDIITFELERELDSESVSRTIQLEAELYISLERARENAAKAGVTLKAELVHLVVHGVLHLAGYDDHEAAARKRMKRRESYYLALLEGEGSNERTPSQNKSAASSRIRRKLS